MLATWASLAAAQNGEPSSAPAVVVRMIEDRFVPATVRIRPGEAVRWDNVSLDTHTVNIDPVAARFPDHSSLPRHSEPVDSGPLGLGASFTHRFELPGRYRYYCQLHEAERMTGVVIVEAR